MAAARLLREYRFECLGKERGKQLILQQQRNKLASPCRLRPEQVVLSLQKRRSSPNVAKTCCYRSKPRRQLPLSLELPQRPIGFHPPPLCPAPLLPILNSISTTPHEHRFHSHPFHDANANAKSTSNSFHPPHLPLSPAPSNSRPLPPPPPRPRPQNDHHHAPPPRPP